MNTFLPSLVAHWPWTATDALTHLWQSTAAAAAVLLVLAWSRGLAARTRRALAWMALVKFALPASVFVQALARFGATPGRWVEADALPGPIVAPVFVVNTAANDAATRLPVGALVAAAWLAGFGVLFASWIVRGIASRRRILAEARPASADVQSRLAAAAARAGLRATPRGLEVASEHGPAVLGLFAPVVILPRGLATTLAPAEFEAVLIHECVHLRRRDNLWSVVQAFFVSALWFHPLVWWLNRRLALDTEQACDERVLEITGDADTYAGGILKSVRHALGVAQPGLAGATTPPVVTRLKNIFAHRARPDRPLVRGAVLAAGGLALAFSGYAGSFAGQSLGDAASESRAAAAVPTATTIPAAAETTLSIDFPDEDIRTIIRNVADLFELNVIIPETLKGRTNVKLRDVTWRQIFDAVLTPVGFTFAVEGNMVRIVPATRAATERAALTYLAEQTARLKREAEAAQQRLAAYQTAHAAEPAGAAERKALEREAQAAANNYAAVRERLQVTQEAASVTAESARLLATGAEREAQMQRQRAQQKTAVRPSAASSGASPAGTASLAPAAPSPTPTELAQSLARPVTLPATLKGVRVYDTAQLDQTPVPRYQARPRYPPALRAQGIEGDALVDFIVDLDGNVQNAYAVRSSRVEFEAPAVQAVGKWKFRPGRKGGYNVHTHMQVLIAFTLNEK